MRLHRFFLVLSCEVYVFFFFCRMDGNGDWLELGGGAVCAGEALGRFLVNGVFVSFCLVLSFS